MAIKIVSDSSSNLLSFAAASYSAVPLKVITKEKEYSDDAALDVEGMIADLRKVHGRTGTSCPNVFEWREAMGDDGDVIAITITSNLSGSYAAAMQAKKELEQESPDRHIAVIDSLSTGPEMQLVIEHLAELIAADKPFSEVEREARAYLAHTHLIFCLQSLENLARNGRVNLLVAKIAGALGIRIVGIASAEGTLELLHKPRGAVRARESILSVMRKQGYQGGRVRIAHCLNEAGATALAEAIRKEFPTAQIEILKTTALCSFYAEEGGLMIGYEDIVS
ncbi:MAG: DegV family protein [Clostridia bacterium]|nr:DegV family protein [Clostridia bacterium]